jgi:ABC-type cobalt transport system substrate-binding protein
MTLRKVKELSQTIHEKQTEQYKGSDLKEQNMRNSKKTCRYSPWYRSVFVEISVGNILTHLRD